MVSYLSVMTHQIENRHYNFICSPDAPISDVKEALVQLMKLACEIEEKAKAEAAKVEEETKV